jgi:hypothetical protein
MNIKLDRRLVHWCLCWLTHCARVCVVGKCRKPDEPFIRLLLPLWASWSLHQTTITLVSITKPSSNYYYPCEHHEAFIKLLSPLWASWSLHQTTITLVSITKPSSNYYHPCEHHEAFIKLLSPLWASWSLHQTTITLVSIMTWIFMRDTRTCCWLVSCHVNLSFSQPTTSVH